METRVGVTAEKHQAGYNCCQAIVCTYCDLFGVDEETAFKLSEGFGAGMGGMQSTCGAVSGAIMLAGLKNSQGTDNTKTKGSTYQIAKEIQKRFTEKNESAICKDLKGIETGKVLRSCPGCIQDAAEIVEELLLSE
jgi:C_GCAxxG_C_C family probable redox protein